MSVPSSQENLFLNYLSHALISETLGPKMTPELAKIYMLFPNLPQSDDEVPWCSMFLYWAALDAGLTELPPKNLASMARSWIHCGDSVENPQTGDIVILK